MNRWMGVVVGLTISLSALAVGFLYPVEANGLGCGTAFIEDSDEIVVPEQASGLEGLLGLGTGSGQAPDLFEQLLGDVEGQQAQAEQDLRDDCARARTQVRVLALIATVAGAVIALASVLLGGRPTTGARSEGDRSDTDPGSPKTVGPPTAPPGPVSAWPGGPPLQGHHPDMAPPS